MGLSGVTGRPKDVERPWVVIVEALPLEHDFRMLLGGE